MTTPASSPLLHCTMANSHNQEVEVCCWQPAEEVKAGMSSPELSSLSSRLWQALEDNEDLSLDELLRRTGIESVGPSIVLLSVLSMVPYVSFFTGAGLMVLGGQLLAGSRRSWLPKGLLRFRMKARHIRASLAGLDRWLRFLGPRPAVRWSVSRPFLGALVLWTAFMLALPLPLIPFANFLPAAGLVLMGVALMEHRPFLVGLGALFSLGGTAYFVLVGKIVLLAFERLF
jgi:hypothetical protein